MSKHFDGLTVGEFGIDVETMLLDIGARIAAVENRLGTETPGDSPEVTTLREKVAGLEKTQSELRKEIAALKGEAKPKAPTSGKGAKANPKTEGETPEPVAATGDGAGDGDAETDPGTETPTPETGPDGGQPEGEGPAGEGSGAETPAGETPKTE
jgi:hypothetical protein